MLLIDGYLNPDWTYQSISQQIRRIHFIEIRAQSKHLTILEFLIGLWTPHQFIPELQRRGSVLEFGALDDGFETDHQITNCQMGDANPLPQVVFITRTFVVVNNVVYPTTSGTAIASPCALIAGKRDDICFATIFTMLRNVIRFVVIVDRNKCECLLFENGLFDADVLASGYVSAASAFEIPRIHKDI